MTQFSITSADASPSPAPFYSEPGVPGMLVTPSGNDGFPFGAMVAVVLIAAVVLGVIALAFRGVARRNKYD